MSWMALIWMFFSQLWSILGQLPFLLLYAEVPSGIWWERGLATKHRLTHRNACVDYAASHSFNEVPYSRFTTLYTKKTGEETSSYKLPHNKPCSSYWSVFSTTSIELVERQGQRKRKFPGLTNSFPFLNLYSHFKSNYSFKNSTLSSVSLISVDRSTCWYFQHYFSQDCNWNQQNWKFKSQGSYWQLTAFF